MKSPRILVRPSGDSGPPEGAPPIRTPGEVLEGKVTAIEGDDVVVTLAVGKALIPTSEFSKLPTVGDAASGKYLIDDRGAGAAILTTQEPEAEVDPKTVRAGAFVRGSVVEAGKPGLRIRCGQCTGFFPSSQLPPGLLRDPGALLRKDVVGFVTEVRNGELTLSLRTVLDRRAKLKTKRRIAAFHEGQRISGTIVRQTDFGFFVDLGGVDGLLHISRLERHNEQRQEKGEEALVLEARQPIEVVISRIEPGRGRIGLDLPEVDQPAASYTPEVAVESSSITEITGILRDVTPEGARVYIEEGIEGWLPTARFAGQSPRPGELRSFRVVSRDEKTGRVDLSLQLRGDLEDDD